jgi:GT2 family glycosyltransferase
MVAAGMNDSASLISVCIANYNGVGVIDDCLQSVLQQVGDIRVEILVHDDASSDGSVDYLRERYPEVRVIASEHNVGFCVANNRMAAQASGKYLLLLNNDAALYPDALQSLCDEANRMGQPVILSLPQYDAASGTLVDHGCFLDPFFNPVPNLDPSRQDVAMVIGACLWIQRAAWEEMGGFPEWFESIAEDMYLCCRMRLAGHPVRVLPVSGYRHWQGKTFGGNRVREGRLETTYRRRALSERNKTYVMVMVCPGPQLMLILPLHLILMQLEGLAIAILKWNMAVWRNIYAPLVPELWRMRSELMDLRREIQSKRSVGLTRWLKAFVAMPYKLSMLIKHGMPEIR